MSKLKDAPVRGLSVLALMQKEAYELTDDLVDDLYNSGINKPALGVLVDGSFGFNLGRLEEVVGYLNDGGRQLHLLIYLTNGASQRDRDPKVPGFGVLLHPETFNDIIQSDVEYQREFLELFFRVLPAVELNYKLGGITRLVPALEDNYTDNAFGAVVSLLASVVPEYVAIGRNPCRDCFPENGDSLDGADFEEVHIRNGGVPVNGVFSNDGISDEPQQFKELRDEAAAKKTWFLYWNADFQGYTVPPVEPSKRNYTPLSVKRRKNIKEFLIGD